MFLRVDTIYLPVIDEEEARDFYAMKVGLPELYDEEDFIGFSVGDTTIVLDDTKRGAVASTISVVVEDITAAVDELTERGIDVSWLGDDESPMDIAIFSDPYGNSWELVQE